MKKLSTILFALTMVLFASCMDKDWDDPNTTPATADIQETNVVNIQDLKDQYKSVIQGSSYTLITQDVQIKGIVTGNDQGGNIYQKFAIQDASGAILINVAKGGLYGEIPVGQEVLINLKGLYIGGYGAQAQIGGEYTNAKTGAKGIGSMDRYLWASCHKNIGSADASKAEALMTTFDVTKASDADYVWQNQGKLMKVENVTYTNGDGKTTIAPESEKDAGNSVNRAFKGISSSKLVLRTSTYAKFAADLVPQGTTSATGIFTVYRSTWQILARTRDDIIK